MKTFTVAGTSILDGVCKIRVANDTNRGNVLTKNGHTDVELVELETAVTKEEAAHQLLKIALFNENPTRLQAIQDFLDSESGNKPVEPKAKKEPKAKAKKEPVVEPVVEQEGDFEMQTAEQVESEFELQEAEVIALPKTIDTVSPEDWATLEAVTTVK